MTHHLVVKVGYFVREPLFVDRPNLFQQNDGIPVEAMGFGVNLDMRRQLSLLNLGRNGRYDNGGAKAVADVILENENRADASLLRADNRR